MWNGVFAQGFINFNFEGSVISNANSHGYDFWVANVRGWTTYNAWGAENFSWGTTVPYNNETLDAGGIMLEGTNYFRPAIQGKYSMFLKGGSQWSYNPDGVALGQTGQIPLSAKSITYWGWGWLVVTFNGQQLSPMNLGDNPNYSIWGADISPYAGQTGELRFTTPWQGWAFLDNIQFSSTAVPEPESYVLIGIGLASFFLMRAKPRFSARSTKGK